MLDTPQAQAASHYMSRKGYNVEPLGMEYVEGETVWYFFYDIEGDLLELEVEYLDGQWFAAVESITSKSELGMSPDEFVEQRIFSVET